VLHVAPEQLGSTVSRVLNGQSAETQIGLEIFPYGIPKPDLMQVHLDVRRNVQSRG
jgi:hypothetical protein